MNLHPNTVRAQLTITTVVVMAVVFVGMGTAIQIAGRAKIMANVDARLARQADEAIQIHKKMEMVRPGPPPDGQGGGGPGGGPGGAPGDGPGGGPDRGPDDRDGNMLMLGRTNVPGPEDQPPSADDPMRRGRGRGGFAQFQRDLRDIGDRLLSIGPRFVPIDPGPPVAPPEMQEAYDRPAVSDAEKQGIVYSDVYVDGKPVRIITKLSRNSDGRRWATQVPHPLEDVDRAISTLNQTLLIMLPFALVLTALASLFLMHRVMSPIREMSLTADSISGEDLSGRLTVKGQDEFARLGGTINGMLGRLESAFQVQRLTLEKLEAVLKQQRRFTADASHELKTPLAVIKANTGLMLQDKGVPADVRSSVEAVDAAATRMNRLVQGLMLLARTESGTDKLPLKPFNLNLAVQNAIDQVHGGPAKQIVYEENDADLTVVGMERDAERVFVNLLDNACRHTREDGNIKAVVSAEGAHAVVKVIDDGEGIAPEHLPHIFDRFYRADSSRSSDTGGTGLGLAICKGIVEAAGGSISIDSHLRLGTMVTVTLPLAAGGDSARGA